MVELCFNDKYLKEVHLIIEPACHETVYPELRGFLCCCFSGRQDRRKALESLLSCHANIVDSLLRREETAGVHAIAAHYAFVEMLTPFFQGVKTGAKLLNLCVLHLFYSEQVGAGLNAAPKLKMSRNSIREALRSLENMGIVESRHGQGTFLVNHIDQRLGSMFSLLLFMKECSVKEVHQLRRRWRGRQCQAPDLLQWVLRFERVCRQILRGHFRESL